MGGLHRGGAKREFRWRRLQALAFVWLSLLAVVTATAVGLALLR